MPPHDRAAEPPTPKPPATGADAWKNQPTSCWPTPPAAQQPISADPEVPERFRQTVARLDDVGQRPVTEHAEAFDAVHRDLRQSLDDVDQSR